MDNKSKQIELAKKLAKFGNAENAEAILQKLMNKYGIKASDLEEEAVSRCYFKYKKQYDFIMKQCIVKVTNQNNVYLVKKGGKRINEYATDCTTFQSVEILGMYDFYCAAYEREVRLYNTDFLARNGLFADFQYIDGAQSEEDKANAYRIRQMMNGIERSPYYKALSK